MYSVLLQFNVCLPGEFREECDKRVSPEKHVLTAGITAQHHLYTFLHLQKFFKNFVTFLAFHINLYIAPYITTHKTLEHTYI